jgi:hypothetical protein
MLHYVTLHYVMLCYIMLCYVISYYIILHIFTVYIYMQVRHLCHHLWRGPTVSLKKNAKWWIFWPSKRPFFLELIFSPFLSNFSKILKHHLQTYHGWPESPNLSMGHFSSTLFEALNYKKLPYQRDPKNLPSRIYHPFSWALSENRTLW